MKNINQLRMLSWPSYNGFPILVFPEWELAWHSDDYLPDSRALVPWNPSSRLGEGSRDKGTDWHYWTGSKSFSRLHPDARVRDSSEQPDLCQDPNHLYLVQILTKIKEHTSFISAAAYDVYIPLHVRFNSVLYQTKISRKLPKILEILRNAGSKIRVCFCQFSWGSNNFIK